MSLGITSISSRLTKFITTGSARCAEYISFRGIAGLEGFYIVDTSHPQAAPDRISSVRSKISGTVSVRVGGYIPGCRERCTGRKEESKRGKMHDDRSLTSFCETEEK